MSALLPYSRRRRRPKPRGVVRLGLEALELRQLPAGNPLLPNLAQAEITANDTLDAALDLGVLAPPRIVFGEGWIGDSRSGNADVDWYQFTLSQSARVILGASGLGESPLAASVLGLYVATGSDAPFAFPDPYHPLGNRQVEQVQGEDGLERDLAAGTYYVAISGGGNRYFHPFLADSGQPGEMGHYQLHLEAAPLPLQEADGPTVLAVDPTPSAALASAPLLIHVSFSTALDPSTVSFDTVRLLDGGGAPVALATVYYSELSKEAILVPATALVPGPYSIHLAGFADAGMPFLAALASGQPLGLDIGHPLGQDYVIGFQVIGNEGHEADAPSDDTPANPHVLGNVADAGLIEVEGAIGDQPLPADFPFGRFNPAADVDLYHFHLDGEGRHALIADVFAGRIGSPLNPALSLFRLDRSTGLLGYVTGNDASLNDVLSSQGWFALFDDPVLFVGLTAGDYYLAVSGTGNFPDPPFGMFPGEDGIFDPNVSHSGRNGFTTGTYVLSLQVVGDDNAPAVTQLELFRDTSSFIPASLNTLPPTRLSVTFSEVMNLRQLALAAYAATGTLHVDSVFVQAEDGTRYFPRLLSAGLTGQMVNFLMYDALPNGSYELHVSGALGLTDLAGNPLTGNHPDGDFVLSFAVNGPARGTEGNPLLWQNQEPNDHFAAPQDHGTLFPGELISGVTFWRDPGQLAGGGSSGWNLQDRADFHRFHVLQDTNYVFMLVDPDGQALPPGSGMILWDEAGNAIPMLTLGGDEARLVGLRAGNYVLQVSGWAPSEAAAVGYTLRIAVVLSHEQPPPLTVGARPASGVAFRASSPQADATLLAPAPADDARLGNSPSQVGSVIIPVTTGPDLGRPLPRVLSVGREDASPEPVGFGNMPSGVLIALGTGPLGGVGTLAEGTPTPPTALIDQVFASGQSSIVADALDGSTDGPRQGSGVEAKESADAATALVQQYLRRLEKLTGGQVARLLARWMQSPRAEGAAGPLTLELDGSEPSENAGLATSAAAHEQRASEEAEAEERLWANLDRKALAAVLAFAVVVGSGVMWSRNTTTRWGTVGLQHARRDCA